MANPVAAEEALPQPTPQLRYAALHERRVANPVAAKEAQLRDVVRNYDITGEQMKLRVQDVCQRKRDKARRTLAQLQAATGNALVQALEEVCEEGGEGGTDLSLAVEQQQKMARLEDQD